MCTDHDGKIFPQKTATEKVTQAVFVLDDGQMTIFMCVQGQIHDLARGSPEFFWQIFAGSAQRSCANKVFHY